jgi:type I restriction-modification system DNA methylase subunit
MKSLIYDMEYSDIQNKIIEYLPVKETEKNKFGEVFTPIELIEEMLDKLPKNVWKNPELKWIDPANGIGNFPMVIYKNLMEGLEDWEPNKRRRHNYIIENMLYMIEINPKNVKISKTIFGNNANICCANFLEDEEKWKRQFEINKFDVIIGNPPFQDDKGPTGPVVNNIKKPSPGGKNKLYERITISCVLLLNDGGYLLFITPDNILTGNRNKTYLKIINYDVIHINLNNIKNRFFTGIGQNMCYFLLKKTKTNEYNTNIINNNGEDLNIIIKDRSVNPVANWSQTTEELIDKFIMNDTNDFIRTNAKKITLDPNGKMSVLENSTKKHKTNDDEIQGYKIPKFILFRMRPSADGLLDVEGNLGLMTDQIYYLPLEKYSNAEIQKIITFFNSEEYKTLQKITTTSQFLKDAFIKSLNIDKIIGISNEIII